MPIYPTTQHPPKTTQEWEQLAQARITALNACFIDNNHDWQPTAITGKQQCAMCHHFAYCPDCFPVIPPHGRIVYCQTHQGVTA